MNSVGVNRRIFDLGYAHDDINHIQYFGTTRKRFLIDDSIPTPLSGFEERITNGEQRYLRPSEIAYQMKEANALGKKPKYIQDRLDELQPIGIYEQAMSHFPYNIGLMRQTQFELGQEQENAVPIQLNGETVFVNRSRLVNSLATSGNIGDSVVKSE